MIANNHVDQLLCLPIAPTPELLELEPQEYRTVAKFQIFLSLRNVGTSESEYC